MSGICDYCRARLPTVDEHRIPIPSAPHGGPKGGVRGVSFWLVHKRCVGPATSHLRFGDANKQSR